MRSRVLLTILLIGFIFLNCNPALAQDDYETSDTTDYSDEEISTYIDTTINFIPYLATDSIESFRLSKDFAYMRYLDSLLKKTKGIKSDTITADGKDSSKIEPSAKHDDDKIVKDTTSPLDNNTVKIILWILAISFLLFVLYKLFFAHGIFKKDMKLKTEESIEETDKEILLSDFDSKIQAAWKANNYKLVIRYRYLQALNRLSEIGHIRFATEKTNYQYVREVYNKPYRNAFASLTLNYEYIWYGNFEIDGAVCKRLESEFIEFNKKL